MNPRPPDLSRHTRLIHLQIADEPEAWAAAGFTVDEGTDGAQVDLGGPVLQLVGRRGSRHGITGWSVASRVGRSRDIDGLPTRFVEPDGSDHAEAHPVKHPNGVIGLDHIVISTPDLDRTIASIAELGVPCRRIRDAGTPKHPMRQGFFKFGPLTIEVVSDDRGKGSDTVESPAHWWGLALDVTDLDRTREILGEEACSEARTAVQPGRRIATLRHGVLDLSVRLAAMDHLGHPPSNEEPTTTGDTP